MTKDYQPISPRKFSGTDWGHLVHGFDMEMTDEYVRYKVAYPIPLNDIPTEYTNKDGDKAHVVFRYDRLMNGTQRVASSMSFDFPYIKKGIGRLFSSFPVEIRSSETIINDITKFEK